MKDIIDSFWELRRKITSIQDEILRDLTIPTDQIPSSTLSQIFNDITIGIELFGFYYSLWTKTVVAEPHVIERAKEQNGERIMKVQRMIFISIMSSFEHTAKEYHNLNPLKLGRIERKDGSIYLRDIIGKSHSIGLISKENFNLWQGLLHLRNILVHNNAISDITETYTYPKVELIFKEGSMTKGNLSMFPNLMDWMVDAIKDWIYQIEDYKPQT